MTAERLSSTHDTEIIDAQAMSEWFGDYLFKVTDEIGDVNHLSRARLDAHYGERTTLDEQLQQARELLAEMDEETQSGVALYICGYPDASIEPLTGMDIKAIKEQFPVADTTLLEEAVAVSSLSKQRKSRPRSTSPKQTPQEAEIFMLDLADESDAPEQKLRVAGATSDAVKDYLAQIGKIQLLTAVQEVELAKSIEVGLFAQAKIDSGQTLDARLAQELEWLAHNGQQSKQQLFEANLRLVVWVAKKYTGRGMPFLDLIQEGNLGLLRAVEKFDYEKGFKFATYAPWWIRQSITRAMADQSRTIRIPVHMHEQLNKMVTTERDMTVRLGRDPSIEELAEELELPVDKIVDFKHYKRQEPGSLNRLLGHDGDTEFGDLLPSYEGGYGEIDDQESYARLYKVLDTLDEREKDIIMRRYGLVSGDKEMLEAIAKDWGLTRERVRQIEKRVKDKLTNHSEFKKLRAALSD